MLRQNPVLRALAPIVVVGAVSVQFLAAAALPDRAQELVAVPSNNVEQRLWSAPVTDSSFKAVADTVWLYGGPGSTEGTFEGPGGAPDLQGWIGVDNTEDAVFWQVSTFNGSNLNSHGPGNHALWCGQTAEQQPGWAAAPGYGNSWTQLVDWAAPVADPQQPTAVLWEFYLNHNSEPAYDFLFLEWDSAGTWHRLADFDGSSVDENWIFQPPGVFSSTAWTASPQSYVDGEVRIRLHFASDGAFSDQDGLWPTDGAVQLDDIVVSFDGTPVDRGGDADGMATFENGDDEGWNPRARSFAGDFSRILPLFHDLDPCRDNLTPQVAFIDDGTPPNNAAVGQSTGGSTSPNWTYGPGGFVVNYTGGLTVGDPLGERPLDNSFLSPEIDWDLPGTADDGIDGAAFLQVDVYEHQPIPNGIFWIWAVRSHDGAEWTEWRNSQFVYFGDQTPRWRTLRLEIRDRLVESPVKVQVDLNVLDLARTFGFPGADATPGPTFDNVAVARSSPGGPRFFVTAANLFQDGFPRSGDLDYAGDPASLYVRMDAANTNAGDYGDQSQDRARIDLIAPVGGAEIAGDPTMTTRLFANPAFDAVREVPPEFTPVGQTTAGWTIYQAVVAGDSVGADNEPPRLTSYEFDVPGDGPGRAMFSPPEADEERFFFPGDSFHYYFEATDTAGNTSRLPGDIAGFDVPGAYDRAFSIHALPSLVSNGGGGVTQPRILVVNDYGHLGEDDEWNLAFAQNGLTEGSDYDIFTVRAPDLGAGNGIGFWPNHGATVSQLADYDCLIYSTGDLIPSQGLVTGDGELAVDLSLLAAWHDLAGDRFTAYLGDNFVTGATARGPFQYVLGRMAVNLVGSTVSGAIDNQRSPQFAPVVGGPSSFASTMVAGGGCPDLFDFDHIEPVAGSGAVRTHEFLTPGGAAGAYAAAAGVWYERPQNVDGTDYQRVDATFPFSLQSLRVTPTNSGGRSASAILLGEILEAFGHPLGLPTPADSPVVAFALLPNQPNPFNPATTIAFDMAAPGRARVEILDLRGRRVRTLVDEELGSGRHRRRFDGRDGGGRPLASGVYFVHLRAGGETAVRKMALVR